MAPRRTTKSGTGLSQPRLSFQSQRKTSIDPKSAAKGSKVVKPSTSSLKRETSGSTPSISTAGSGSGVIEIDHDETDLAKTDAADAVKAGKVQKVGKEEEEPTRHLDVKSKEWEGLVKDANRAMGGLKPIHAGPETHNNIHHVLRVFDMTTKYGPSVGRTRLERWERANKLGLNPPTEIKEILMTIEGKADPAYRENVLYGWV